MADLKLTLVTPTKKIVTDLPIENVIVPGYRGELDIMEDHAPLVTTLSTGVLQYREVGIPEPKKAALSWGYLEVFDNHVSILAETAETAEDIDSKRAHIAFEKSQNALASANAGDIEKHMRKMERSKLRRDLAKDQRDS